MVKQIKKIYWLITDFIYCVIRKREFVFLILFLQLFILIDIWLKVYKILKTLKGG